MRRVHSDKIPTWSDLQSQQQRVMYIIYKPLLAWAVGGVEDEAFCGAGWPQQLLSCLKASRTQSLHLMETFYG